MSKVKIPGQESNPDTVPENTSGVLEFDLIDPTTGNAVPGSAVTSATLKIVNRNSGAEVQAAVDVASKFDQSTGAFQYVIPHTVANIQDDSGALEWEDLLGILIADFNTGAGSLHIEVPILIRISQQEHIS